MKWNYHFPDSFDSGQRLDVAIPPLYTAEHPDHPLSRSQFKNWIESGSVRLNGETAKASDVPVAGDVLEIEIPEIKMLDLIPIAMELEILYEDEDLAIINKPTRISVHPSDTDSGPTLVHGLLHHFKNLSSIGGVFRPGIVHRLDKNTSGTLVITKSDRAHLPLSEIFAAHRIERQYWALCYGSLVSSSPRKIETLIGRHPVDRKKMAILEKGGKKAVTHILPKERYAEKGHAPFASWMECRLETGRTHQVRVHLTSLGCPLIGDTTYGNPRLTPARVREPIQKLPGQALHSRLIGFTHPITKKDLIIEAPAPKEFTDLHRELQRYVT